MAAETCGAESIYLLQRSALRCKFPSYLACFILGLIFPPVGQTMTDSCCKPRAQTDGDLVDEAAATKHCHSCKLGVLATLCRLVTQHRQRCNFLRRYEAGCNHSDV